MQKINLKKETIKAIADRFLTNPAFASKAYLYETWEAELEEEAALPVDPPVRKADTLEELAVACGMDKDVFLETVPAVEPLPTQFCQLFEPFKWARYLIAPVRLPRLSVTANASMAVVLPAGALLAQSFPFR